ncbi:CLUMA_CG014614, isoform A [Clunio marinus]|uniref:CLUMA_CG014614, isoform A n=1 Tax=Clunio marinus TaxID=568069 RepID=A0A1J1IQG6_9DIPT|nr:CLUMA_CG014614, isoform A [Clunio marinus]
MFHTHKFIKLAIHKHRHFHVIHGHGGHDDETVAGTSTVGGTGTGTYAKEFIKQIDCFSIKVTEIQNKHEINCCK